MLNQIFNLNSSGTPKAQGHNEQEAGDRRYLLVSPRHHQERVKRAMKKGTMRSYQNNALLRWDILLSGPPALIICRHSLSSLVFVSDRQATERWSSASRSKLIARLARLASRHRARARRAHASRAQSARRALPDLLVSRTTHTDRSWQSIGVSLRQILACPCVAYRCESGF